MTDVRPPTLDAFRDAAERIRPYVNETPVQAWRGVGIEAAAPPGAHVVLKLELFQRAGAFKARGAVLNLLRLDPEQRARGVTTVSSGNHAVAVAYASRALGVDAKVVMLSTANPARIAAAESYGAQVVIGGDGTASFALGERIAGEEGRAFIHPFEGEGCTLGSGTLGLEFVAQTQGQLDAVIIPVGGGGLASGAANAVRALLPTCEVFGVEPTGADSMSRSFAAGAPVRLEKVSTIADSLASPMALPYSYAMCRHALADIVTVSDREIARSALLLFQEMKLAVEPAAAAATAALVGPLREHLAGKRVGLIICGTNIDADGHARLMQLAREAA
jgi:threonine dehydratase